MALLVITRGLPASGKTRMARAWVKQNPEGRVRVNRDDLRAMCHDGMLRSLRVDGKLTSSPWQEDVITAIQEAAVAAAITSMRDVVADDTNLPLKHVDRWRQLAAALNADFEVWDLTGVPLSMCLARDALRIGTPAFVSPDVIRRMHDQYLAPPAPQRAGGALEDVGNG